MAQQNFFGQLYVDLANYLKTAVPKLRWIDMDFGQLEHFEYKPEVAFPCALIDFPAANYTGMSELAQMGDILVNVKIGFAPFSQSHTTAPLSVKEKALEYFTIEQEVFEALQGWHNSFTQPFIRQNAVTDSRYEEIGLRVRVLAFGTAYEDLSALPMYQKVAATLEIQQEVKADLDTP